MLAWLLTLAGCYAAYERRGETGPDGMRDGALAEGGRRDAGNDADAGMFHDIDAAPSDAGLSDGSAFEGGALDAGALDAGALDAGDSDVGALDASMDAGPGPRSVALRFAPDDFVYIPDRPALSVGPDTTYEMWVRARGPGLLSRKGFDTGVQHHAVRLEHDPDGRFVISAGWTLGGGERREVRAPFDAYLGRWAHIAIVIQRVAPFLRVRLYVDFEIAGVADLPDDLGRAYSLEPLLLGRFDGDIDEVRLWGSVRDGETLRAHAFMRLRPGTTGLVAYWPIEEASSQFLLDRSLRGNDGILGATTTGDDSDPMWITDGPIP